VCRSLLKYEFFCRFCKEDHTEGVPSTAIREISILKGLRHSSIIELQDVMYTSDRLYLVFEYLELDLKRYLDGTSKPVDKELIRVSFPSQNRHFHCFKFSYKMTKTK
jgi:serine/threonine protein kinase